MECEIYKEADFYKYCKTCKYKDLKEDESPCDDCLEEPVIAYSHKPAYWEEED